MDIQKADLTTAPANGNQHVVILGAGFGGLACARALGSQPIRVTVVDQKNYHLFVPLLYQVATAALSPAEIAEPVRKILRRHKNIDVVMGEVCGVDLQAKQVRIDGLGNIPFDHLVLATGSQYNYFGHDDWSAVAPGLKSIADARQIRTKVLVGFERAELSRDPAAQTALTTSIIVGGGPTGVEMAGAIAELARWSLRRDFRIIDPTRARIILVEAGARILSTFPEHLSDYAMQRLERLGVTVLTERSVEHIEAGAVTIGGERIEANTIVWAAGIAASPAAGWIGVEPDRLGRVPVNEDLSVKGLFDVYAIGDTAAARGTDGKPLPALAQVAKQQGAYLGRSLAKRLAGQTASEPFRFKNRGNTAVIGRSAAVFDFGSHQLRGWFAWLLWALVDVYLLVGFEKRVLVSIQWFWRWLTYQSGARLISDDISAGIKDHSASAGSD